MTQLVALQMSSGPSPEHNLAIVDEQLQRLDASTPTLVVLPECFACFGVKDQQQLEIAEQPGDGPIQRALSAMCRQYGIWMVAGTVPIRHANGKFSATSILFNAAGEQVCRYQKIHLFDVQLEDDTGCYRESKYTHPGDRVVVADTPFGRLGLAVCYDLRFPGLFQAMGQVDVMVLPAAFTQVTGEAHWHGLLNSRSIEKQAYMVAAGQYGRHQNGRTTYGHSIIYSPWGSALGSIEHGTGCVSANIDWQLLDDIRQRMPVHQHNKFRSHII